MGRVDGHVLLYWGTVQIGRGRDGEIDIGEVEGWDKVVFPHLVGEGRGVDSVRGPTHHYQRLPGLKTNNLFSRCTPFINIFLTRSLSG